MRGMPAHPRSDSPRVLLVEEVAQLLRVSPDSVRRQLADGHLPGVKVGGAWRIPADRLDAYLNGDLDEATA